MVKKKTQYRKQTKRKSSRSIGTLLFRNKKLNYALAIFVLLFFGIVGYAAYEGLSASGAVCRQSSVTSRVHLTNTTLLFKNSDQVKFCVGGAAGSLTMKIRNSGGGVVWEKHLSNAKPVKAPNYLSIDPDVKLSTGSYTFALLDRGTDKRVDVSFGVTGSKPEDDPYYAINTHYIKASSKGRADISTYRMLDQIGVSSVRETLAWHTVEKQKSSFAMPGTYVGDLMNAAKKNNDSVIFVAAYGNELFTGANSAPPSTDSQIKRYAAYIDYVLDTYPQIKQVEIYNEYDHVADKSKNSSTGGTGREYAELVKKTASYLRNDFGQKQVKIIAGSISTLAGSGGETCQCNDINRFNGWWESFGAAGGFKAADAVSFHRYDDTIPSDQTAYHKRLDEIVKKYNNGKSMPIVVSEVGLTTAATGQWRGVVVNERDQAAGLVRTYIGYMRGKLVSSVAWYDAFDDGDEAGNIEHNWGIFKRPTADAPYTYQPKWSALAFYWMRRELDDGYRLTEVTQPVGGVQQYTFTKGDSKRYVLWRDGLFASNDQSSVNVTVNIRPNAPTNVYNMLGERMAEADKKYTDGKITIPVWTTPMYINN